jgi:hypothetical protein
MQLVTIERVLRHAGIDAKWILTKY